MSPDDADDKRKHRRAEAAFAARYRVRSPLDVKLQFGVQERDAIAYDISEGGLSLSTDFTLPSGSVIDITFRLYNSAAAVEPDRARKFALQAEACYGRSMPDRSFRVGVRFLNATAEDRRFIANSLRGLRSSK